MGTGKWKSGTNCLSGLRESASFRSNGYSFLPTDLALSTIPSSRQSISCAGASALSKHAPQPFSINTQLGIIRPMREHKPREEKPLHWVGSAKKDLLGFPEQVMDDVGFALGVVQYGGHPPSAKPWKGLGPGVLEIVENDESGTYRAVYTVRFRKAVYVLHAFQKKSPSGIRTARTDVKLVATRLSDAMRDYEERYGKETG